MSDTPYRFTVEVLRDGSVLAAVPASIRTCLEDARFRAVVAGAVPNDGAELALGVEPVWLASRPPAVAGVRLCRPGAPPELYPRRVFAPWARSAIIELVRAERLGAEDEIVWRVVAHAESLAPPARFRGRAVRAPYPLHAASLPWTLAKPGEVAVEIAGTVIAALRAATLGAGAIECAALLTGHLRHDRERRVAALRVTGQIPVIAGRGGASGSHFAFGPDTFAAARRAHAERTDGSIIAGWFHSHPACAGCVHHPECTNDMIFFSHDDSLVHAAAFPQPYLVALVAGKASDRPATHPGVGLFVWQRGAIAARPLEALRIAGENGVTAPHDEVYLG